MPSEEELANTTNAIDIQQSVEEKYAPESLPFETVATSSFDIPMKNVRPFQRPPTLKTCYKQSPFISITASTPGTEDEYQNPLSSNETFRQVKNGNLRRHSSSEMSENAKQRSRTSSLPRLQSSMEVCRYNCNTN